MVSDVTEEWLTISLKEPYLFVGTPQSLEAQCLIEGSITVTVSKATKVRWLRLRLAGLARSAFSFDSSRIPAAKRCEPCGSAFHSVFKRH
ncbi:hypothetical protein BGZ58_010145 [Dissophora ornata]|nr:hypothetical protein BGZ58_010145 [Dissophora ornata]